jgi:hypothetical protein
MSHVVLLGDSIFDNAAYVHGAPDVIEQVRKRLPGGWTATLCAVDGDVTGDVPRQLKRVPHGATHLVMSVGGNDALGHLDLLAEGTQSMAAALDRLAEVAEGFERKYLAALDAVLARGLPTAICTIYYPRFPDAYQQRLGVAALTHFNDTIQRAAYTAGIPLLDLRLICNEDADYANPVEPSTRGGDKIAAAIVRAVTEHDFGRRRTEVFVR